MLSLAVLTGKSCKLLNHSWISRNSLESQGVLQALCLGTVKKDEDFLCMGKQDCYSALREVTRQHYKSPILVESFTSPFGTLSSFYNFKLAHCRTRYPFNLEPESSAVPAWLVGMDGAVVAQWPRLWATDQNVVLFKPLSPVSWLTLNFDPNFLTN